MPTELDLFLDEIDPSRTYDPIQQYVDEGINMFPRAITEVYDWYTFRSFITHFYMYITYDLSGIVYSERETMRAWKEFQEILGPRYGREPASAAYKKAIHGHEGGLRSVMQDLADGVVEKHAAMLIRWRVTCYLGELSFDEKVDAVKEYVTKWGHFLPRDITPENSVRIFYEFHRFLEAHPKLLREIRTVR